jgi:hypothetical protein
MSEESEVEESGTEEDEDKRGGADEDEENSDEVSAEHAACSAQRHSPPLFCRDRARSRRAAAQPALTRCACPQESDDHRSPAGTQDSDDDLPKRKARAAAATPRGSATGGGLSVPESIPTEVTVKGPGEQTFVFGRTIKKRPRPVPRIFDVEYRILQPAGSRAPGDARVPFRANC